METAEKKIGLLLIRNKLIDSVTQESVASTLRSYSQIRLFEVTHPEYPEFATMTSKDDITIVMTFIFISINVVMKECPNIQWVHAFSTGCDRLINYEPFRESPITLTVTRGASAVGLTEFTIGAMIYFSRKFRAWDELQLQSTWGSFLTTDISKKKITIVGYGKVGSKIGRTCKDLFEMEVVGVKNRVDDASYKNHPEVEKFYRLSELGEACEGADFVVGILPGGKETESVFGLEVFKRFKKTAVFISIGRGSNVVEEDLIEALKKGYIGGAALDVFKVEPLPKTSPFYTDEEIKSKILITCHYACYSEAITEEIFRMFKTNLEIYLAKQPLENVVDKELGY